MKYVHCAINQKAYKDLNALKLLDFFWKQDKESSFHISDIAYLSIIYTKVQYLMVACDIYIFLGY
jgi:hypothetical protein